MDKFRERLNVVKRLMLSFFYFIGILDYRYCLDINYFIEDKMFDR